jgi:aspartyl-tRNA(Asn)/glutamyl-tRNA(Gln) amidotransferase subunit A
VADVLVSPTAPTTAFKIGEKLDDPLAMYLNDVATIPANLAGIPGMSLPCGLAAEDGLPTGFQILAPATHDERLYAVGSALERELAIRWGGHLLDKIRNWRPRLRGRRDERAPDGRRLDGRGGD